MILEKILNQNPELMSSSQRAGEQGFFCFVFVFGDGLTP